MQKLKLDLDALTVDTFATGEEMDARGTVHGHLNKQGDPTYSINDQMTCGQNSCAGASCYTCSICMTIGMGCPQEPAGEFEDFAA